MKKLSILSLSLLSLLAIIACTNGSGGSGVDSKTSVTGLTASYASITAAVGSAIIDITFTPAPAGATGTYAVTTGTLPTGLSINPSTGVISGTPTATKASESYTITFTGTGGYTGTATANVTIEVNANTIAVTGLTASPTSVTADVGTAITITFTPAPAGATGTYAVTTGTLPTGLSINPSTGVISGTPTATKASESYTITLTGTGGYTGTATANVTIEVEAAPVPKPKVYAAYSTAASGTIQFDFGATVTNPSITGKTAAGIAVAGPTVSAVGNSVSGTNADAFVVRVSSGGSITVNATAGGVKYSNTYGYYSGGVGVTVNTGAEERLILGPTDAIFYTSGSNINREISVFGVAFLNTGGGDDQVWVSGLIRNTSYLGSGNDVVTFVTGGSLAKTKAISGDAGNDTFIGSSGTDEFIGGDGNDIFTGNGGSDEFQGLAGADTFIYIAAGDGSDTFIDFTSGEDKIDMFGDGRLISGAKTGNAFVTWDGNGTAAANSVVESQNNSALADNAAAAAMFEDSTGTDAGKMILAQGNSIIFVRQYSGTGGAAAGSNYDAQIFHVTNSGGTITATLMVTMEDARGLLDVRTAFGDFE